MRSRPSVLALGMCLLVAAVAGGQQTGEGSEEEELLQVLEGFDDDPVETAEHDTGDSTRQHRFRLGGHLRLGSSYGLHHHTPPPGTVDWQGLTRLRPQLQLEAELRPSERWRIHLGGRADSDLAYALAGRDRYPEQVLERSEHDLELLETFVAVTLGRGVDLSVGRQIVAWGTSENLRVTDVLNPMDLREPGIADIEELRLPVAMTRLDLSRGRWSLSGLAIHEIRFDRTPGFGHDLFPAAQPLPREEEPANSLDSTELGLAVRGSFTGWDLSFFLARIFDDTPHLELDPGPGFSRVPTQASRVDEMREDLDALVLTGSAGVPGGTSSIPGSVQSARDRASRRQDPLALGLIPVLRHSRLHMLGVAWDLAAGDSLFKVEAAHLRGLRFFNRPGEELARSDLLVGVEYAGFAETSLTVEVVGRYLHDHSPELRWYPDLAAESKLSWVVRLSRSFLHQTLMLTLLSMQLGPGGEDGALQRLEARYDLNDALEITTGLVLYRSGSEPGFETIGAADRLFLDITYRF